MTFDGLGSPWSRVPTYDELNWPSLLALRSCGGSATIAEHYGKLIELFHVPDQISSVPHGDTGRTELEYRLAWSRTGLRRAGLIENSSRGVWSLTKSGESATQEDVLKAIAEVRAADLKARATIKPAETVSESEQPAHVDWKDSLLTILRSLSPAAFERLSQRVLRESGFTKVEVTGRSGDGGIDGTGILQLSLMSFPVLFQCKRYQGSVGASAIRDFRGAMMGRTDKGLFITTGTFSSDARREATRDGAPPIELIDGQQLCEHLKALKLGVEVKLVEVIEPNESWFRQL